jgi:hypothetical protein
VKFPASDEIDDVVSGNAQVFSQKEGRPEAAFDLFVCGE